MWRKARWKIRSHISQRNTSDHRLFIERWANGSCTCNLEDSNRSRAVSSSFADKSTSPCTYSNKKPSTCLSTIYRQRNLIARVQRTLFFHVKRSIISNPRSMQILAKQLELCAYVCSLRCILRQASHHSHRTLGEKWDRRSTPTRVQMTPWGHSPFSTKLRR